MTVGVFSQQPLKQVKEYSKKASVYPGKFNTNLNYEVQAFHSVIIKNIKIKGSTKSYNFLFDTGCTTSSISKEVAKDINLKSLFKDTISDGYTTQLENFGLIDMEFKGIQFNNILVSDNANLPAHCNIDGIIGINIIKLAVWKINLINHEIQLTNTVKNIKDYDTYYKQRIDKYNLKKNKNFLTVAARITPNIKFGTFFLDLGDNGFVTLCIDTSKVYSKRDLIKWEEENKTIHSKGTAIQTDFDLIVDTTIGYNRINADRFHFADVNKYPAENTENYLSNPKVYYDIKADIPVLGAGILDYYSIIFDLKKFDFYTKLINKDNKGASMSFGFAIVILNDTARVATVWENSSAEKQGMKAGDKIVQLNNLNFENNPKPICEIYQEIEKIFNNNKIVDVIFIDSEKRQHNVKINKLNLF